MPTHSHVQMHHQLEFENAHPHGKSSSNNNGHGKNFIMEGKSRANLARERAHRESDVYDVSASAAEEPPSLHTAHEDEEDVHVHAHEEEENKEDDTRTRSFLMPGVPGREYTFFDSNGCREVSGRHV